MKIDGNTSSHISDKERSLLSTETAKVKTLISRMMTTTFLTQKLE